MRKRVFLENMENKLRRHFLTFCAESYLRKIMYEVHNEGLICDYVFIIAIFGPVYV